MLANYQTTTQGSQGVAQPQRPEFRNKRSVAAVCSLPTTSKAAAVMRSSLFAVEAAIGAALTKLYL
jgi:hypothetical protein